MFADYTMKKDSRRLAPTKRAAYREDMRELQGGRDPITGAVIKKAFIDHCHLTGFCRAILNPTTNTFEGKLNSLLESLSINRCDYAAVLFNAALIKDELYNSFSELIMQCWPYQSTDLFIKNVLLNMGVYYSALWSEMGHLLYEEVK